jgi:hypothetical protein
LIRHAGLKLPVAIILLTITMIGLAIVCLLVFAIGFTVLALADFLSAIFTAIALSSIAAATDKELRATIGGQTESLAKDNTIVPSLAAAHAYPIAR